MLSFNLILPELFEYLTLMGGKDYKGLVVFLFSLASILSRPISGQLTDTIGRKPVIMFGLLVCFFSGLIYPFATSVWLFMLLRSFHGLSAGFTPTANSAAVVDIIPESRRGEALGIIGFASSMGMTLGPVIGSWIKLKYGFDVLFLSSSLAAFISIANVFDLKETLPQKTPHNLLQINKDSFWEPLVLFPALVYLLYITSYAIVFTVIPDFSDHLGIKNKGLFFLVSVGSSSIIRILTGKISDKWGRILPLFIGILLLIASMIIIGSAKEQFSFLMGGVIIGFSVGIVTPCVMAWSSDLADHKFMGRAFSTLFLCLEIGVSISSILASLIYDNKAENFSKTFYGMSIFACFSLLFLYFGYSKQKSQS